METFILEEFSICRFEDPKIFVDQLLITGNALLLFDGLDEVGTRIDEAIREVQKLSTRCPKIKLFVSCRTAAYNYVFPDFKDVEIADFSETQVKQFVQNWFRVSKGKDKAFIRELGLPKNKAIANLCSTPLLLTLLCLAFDDAMAFPPNRAELYKDALDALLKKWDSSRAILRESSYKSLSLAKKELLLSRLAFNTFSNNRYFIKQSYLEGEIADFMRNLKSATPENGDIEGERVLKEIESQHGLLVERAHHVYSFSHLTFQEFFTARYITENTNKNKGPDYLISHHLGDVRWNEVFILTTGLLAEADEFLLEMRKRLSLTMRDLKLIELLTRLCAIVVDSSDIPEPVRRALAIYYVTNELGKTQSEFRAAHVASRELLDDMQKEFGKISNLDLQTLKVLKLGLHQNRELLDEAVSDIINLETKQIKALAGYIRGTRLLVNCLNVDAYVTAATRSTIVKSIFFEPWILTAA
ncbi:MAG: signal transduction protein [uncultured bacterium]|nr:MAG: signal transduction protein [uncultured bacterium]